MTENNVRRASLAEIRRMKDRGELFHDPNAPYGEDLGAEFWAKAELVTPAKPRFVHLKLDQDVFDFFHAESGGKGHLTRMQNVLKAYVKARQAHRASEPAS